MKHKLLKKLLTKKKSERTENDDHLLLNLMKEMKFFDDKYLSDEELLELIQHFEFESYN